MKNLFVGVCIGVALSISCALSLHAASGLCHIEELNYRGWNSFKLSNDSISLHVVPEIGGRIIQFQLGQHPFLFVNPELAGKVFPPEENGGEKGGWKNYGGDKLWPAPQGWDNDEQWPGPGDPILDGGKFSSEIVKRQSDEVSIRVTSPPDPRTGIQFSRTISIFSGSTRVHHDCVMRNISQRNVRWSIWEVIQHDTADPSDSMTFNHDLWAYTPLNAHSVHPRKFAPMYGQVTHPSWRPDYANQLLAVKYDDRVGKVGVDSDAGWLAVANGKSDHCFVGRFKFFPGRIYPDNASVEFWLNGAGEVIVNGNAFTNAPGPKQTPYYMESEILSPLTELKPGEEYHFEVDWFATRCPKPIVETTDVAAVNKRLVVTVLKRKAHLEGIFGVFYKGRAEAVFKDSLGTTLGRKTLGDVNPDNVFRISKDVPIPAKTYRVTVNVLDSTGTLLGALGNIILPPE